METSKEPATVAPDPDAAALKDDEVAEDDNTSESHPIASPADDEEDAFKDALDSVPGVEEDLVQAADEDEDDSKSDEKTVADVKDDSEKPADAEIAENNGNDGAASPAKTLEVEEDTDKTDEPAAAILTADGDQEIDRPEEVDMESMDDTIDKDKSVSEDPFDQLRQNTNVTRGTKQSASDAATDKTRDDDSDDDDAAGGEEVSHDVAAAGDEDNEAAVAVGDEDNEADGSPNTTLNNSDDHDHDNEDADGIAETTPAASEAGGDESSAVDSK